MRLTHKKLCELGAGWLKRRAPQKYPVVFVEMKTLGIEIPDVIGFNSESSVIIEAKTSRSDFKKDADKFVRKHPKTGVGNYRFYICKEGLIKKDELPKKWGLLYVCKYNVIKVIKSPLKGNIDNVNNRNRFKVDKSRERQIMYSALRRVFNKEKYKKYFHM